jgi:rubrerythrin
MDALEILNRAQQFEQEGEKFYHKAAGATDDADTKRMFLSLAEAEQDHHRYLERQREAIAAGRSWLPVPELQERGTGEVSAPDFPEGLAAVDQLPQNATDEEALLFALGVEKKAYELYVEAARTIDDPNAKALFGFLAREEREHFDTLLHRYTAARGYPG